MDAAPAKSEPAAPTPPSPPKRPRRLPEPIRVFALLTLEGLVMLVPVLSIFLGAEILRDESSKSHRGN